MELFLEEFMKKWLIGGAVLLSLLMVLAGCPNDTPTEETSRIIITGIPAEVNFIMVTASTDNAGVSGAAVLGGYFDAALASDSYTPHIRGNEITTAHEAEVNLYESGSALAWLMSAQQGTEAAAPTPQKISGTGTVVVSYMTGSSTNPADMVSKSFNSVSFNAETITLSW
ncbi:MAG: hypothetical protein LBP60_02155 [Spirochaetaceae bacterium]|jgi:hypothetical protein|nr:hypothetical protein [Spirochaetaceae bacterium]